MCGPNQAIIRERHPIPTVEELLYDMNSSRIFSKIDMREGFSQLVLHPNSRSITTFASHVGLFRYKRLNYGTCSAPERYQAEIQRLVQGIPGVANLADDIIVHGADKDEHDSRLVKVLDRLKNAGLTLNGDKCKFGVEELEFVGHKLSAKGIDAASSKVESIVNAGEPQNVSELKSFLGLLNYVSRFILDYSTKTEPLRRLTRKNEKFCFGKEQKEAFKILKQELSSSETLGYFDLKYPTKVVADASPVGLGAVLVQIQEDGPRIISYASRSLTDVEKRYCQTEREALSLVWACERFRAYLLGIQFDLVTDHEPLKTIYGPKSKPCARIERWVLRLMPYDYRVEYWPGSKNIADCLSRLGCKDVDKNDNLSAQTKSHVRFVALNSVPRAMTAKEIDKASAIDNELRTLSKCIETGCFDIIGLASSYKLIRDELCIVGNLVLRGNRIVIPAVLRPHVIELAHSGHVGSARMKELLRTKVWWPKLDKDVDCFVRGCHGCQIVTKPTNPEPIIATVLPDKPFQDIAVDHFGPINQNYYILVVIDYYSRYFECKHVKSTDAKTTIQALEEVFLTHGLPETLKSDSGPCFISAEFKTFCENLDIKHSKGTPRWPPNNGLAESCMKSIKKRLQIAVNTGVDWKSELNRYLFSYRTTPHPATGKTPAELLFGRKLRTKIPDLTPDLHVLNDSDVRKRDSDYKAKTKEYADKKRKAVISDICVGDEVLLKRDQMSCKTDTPFYVEPYVVVNKKGSQVTVRSSDGREYVRNSSHLKAYKRAHEIILPSFVGKEEDGSNIRGSTSNKDVMRYDNSNPDEYTTTENDNSNSQDLHVQRRYAKKKESTDPYKQTLRRSDRSRIEPKRYGQAHCKLHCCLSRSEGE